MKKKISNSDFIRKLENTDTTTPAYLDNVKDIKDSGFRWYMGEQITKDENRRKDFVNSKKVVEK